MLPSHPTNSRDILHTRGVIINDAAGNIVVFNSQTQQVIPQGSASDGGGSGFDAVAVLWMVLSFLLGIPLAAAGVRGWKLTLGVAIGLSTAGGCKYPYAIFSSYCFNNSLDCNLAWAAFINTVSSQEFSDIALDGIVFLFFAMGFVIGLFPFGRIAGITCIGAVGGLTIGMRVVMFKHGLLIPVFFVNWIIVAGCGVCGLLLILLSQRIAIVSFYSIFFALLDLH
jgi:hypothetical protein